MENGVFFAFIKEDIANKVSSLFIQEEKTLIFRFYLPSFSVYKRYLCTIVLLTPNKTTLHLQQLKITNFRNYESGKLEFSEKLNCFVGKNGVGKTNLLDAVYYLCMCKSYFGVPDTVVALHQAPFFRAEGLFSRNGRTEKVVAKVKVRRKKIFECNDVAYKKLSEHIGLIPVVMIAPDDTRLATDGSEVRRRFIDNTLAQLAPDYLRQLIIYTKVLEQRNATLKHFAKTGTYNTALIASYDSQLLEPAANIFEYRKQFIEEFIPFFQLYYGIISGQNEEVSCTYSSPLAENTMEQILEKNKQRDRILQRTSSGIHKDDLVFVINGRPLKRYASQGQLKSFVLAVKLAQYEFIRQQKKIAPLLLLDDIFDKLDKLRVRQLLGLLLERDFGQIFITDTHENRVEGILKGFSENFKKFIVDEGKIRIAS